jgi:hypothetical protein
MNLEQVTVDEVLSAGEESFEVSFWYDACREQILLLEDMTKRMGFSTPVVERIGNTVSGRSLGRARSRGGCGMRGCHDSGESGS